MTLIWLGVWLLSHTPELVTWNDWMVALVICIIADALR
jgi:hypothetical protein